MCGTTFELARWFEEHASGAVYAEQMNYRTFQEYVPYFRSEYPRYLLSTCLVIFVFNECGPGYRHDEMPYR